jgi:agmatine/peptidylarginine deiminase
MRQHTARLLFAPALAVLALSVLLAAPAADAGQLRTVPPEVLAGIQDDSATPPLPRGLAPGERSLPLPTLVVGAAPPAVADTPAEYQRNLGLLIRWGDFNSVLTAMTVAVTTGAEQGTVWVVVSGSPQQASALATLSMAGADMARVSFLTAPTNTVWIRDYGPRFIREGADPELSVVDHTYNRPRPSDNSIPDFVATAWGLAGYDLPLTHGGGNFHLFGGGEALMSDLVLDENPGLSAQDVEDLFAAYEALDVTVWPSFPSSYDSTRHIDMWMLPIRDRAVIIGEYSAADGTPHTVTEAAVTELQTRGYAVYRTPGWRAGGTHYTYTNAVLINELALVPVYSGYDTENAEALEVFQEALPGYQVVPIDATQLVTFAGVLHCIVMHVPDPAWIFGDDFETGDLAGWTAAAP